MPNVSLSNIKNVSDILYLSDKDLKILSKQAMNRVIDSTLIEQPLNRLIDSETYDIRMRDLFVTKTIMKISMECMRRWSNAEYIDKKLLIEKI